jgi:predicted acetyltransferase
MTEIRELNEGDLAAWTRIGAQAYRRGNLGDSPPQWPTGGEFTRLGLFEDGQQVAQFHLWHYEMFFNGQRVPMGGVASVACLPLARGRGHVEALLRHGLERMHERGEPLSVLHAFLVGLYRPMGWEWAGSTRSYMLPLAHLPAGLDTRRVRPAGPEDAETLRDLYEAEAARYQGTLVRPLSWWRQRLETTTGYTAYFYLYEDAAPRGYLALTLQEPARVRELIARTPEAYAALLGVLRSHKSQLTQFVWDAPPDDPLWHYAANWDVKVAWKPSFSARVVDLPAAVALLQPDPALSGACTIQLQDALTSRNTGSWEITAEGGAATAVRTTRRPQLAADIGACSQLLFGDPDAASLRRASRLTASDEAAYAFLSALCPPALCWTNDGF